MPVFRPESFATRSSGNIPVSVQELVYGGREGGVGPSAKSLDGKNELLSSSEEFRVPREYSRPSKGLDTQFLQRTSPKDKSLVEKPKHFVRGRKEGKNPSGRSSSLHKKEPSSTSAKKVQESPKEQAKGKDQVEQALPTKLQNSKERKVIHGYCFQYGNSCDGIKKQGEGNI
ncbi:hypothetical protein O181_084261 [Austropuccinia psidii MF-1]|uniref:Uncharacterized protein n=1 Tax=Austropuccinia psidii MF-1 TaxID=1389203 RepID=A0A9Q3FQM9_9BASI|nr:hypothetical protein [Austropuccinia psidii MF-1]